MGGVEFLINLKYEFKSKEGILNGMAVRFIDLGLAPDTLPFWENLRSTLQPESFWRLIWEVSRMIRFLNSPRAERETEREFLHLGPERESLSKENKIPEVLKMDSK